jgi:hypothetical protein
VEAINPKDNDADLKPEELEAKNVHDKAVDEIGTNEAMEHNNPANYTNDNVIKHPIVNDQSKKDGVYAGMDDELITNYDMMKDKDVIDELHELDGVNDFKNEIKKIDKDKQKKKVEQAFHSQTELMKKEGVVQKPPDKNVYQFEYDDIVLQNKKDKENSSEDLTIEPLEEADPEFKNTENTTYRKKQKIKDKIVANDHETTPEMTKIEEDQTIVDDKTQHKVTKDETVVDDQVDEDGEGHVTKDESVVDDQENQDGEGQQEVTKDESVVDDDEEIVNSEADKEQREEEFVSIFEATFGVMMLGVVMLGFM